MRMWLKWLKTESKLNNAAQSNNPTVSESTITPESIVVIERAVQQCDAQTQRKMVQLEEEEEVSA
ncbi:hypothetical protein PQX77_002856, partial [Marasmius sp. AFHP31]